MDLYEFEKTSFNSPYPVLMTTPASHFSIPCPRLDEREAKGSDYTERRLFKGAEKFPYNFQKMKKYFFLIFLKIISFYTLFFDSLNS